MKLTPHALVILLSLCSLAHGAGTAPEENDPQTRLDKYYAELANVRNPEQMDTLRTKIRREEARRQFLGLDFGLGLSLAVDLQGGVIDDASVVNGRVRVSREKRARPRVLLESHYFFAPRARSFLGLDSDRWGYGPFVALQGSDEEVIEAFGLGWMFGLRPKDDSSNAFNLGIGLLFDPQVRVLGNGIRDNDPLPAGETEVRFREEDHVSLLLSISLSY